jgi:AcrR family transcriptional regulator
MSSEKPQRQRRPTREETRARLLDAAASVFVERGIATASVEEIAEAAGFSRGAVYSNFVDKDELVLALLQRISDDSAKELEELYERHPDPDAYVRATQELMTSPERHRGHHHPVLSIELVLYSLRNPKARPILQERLKRSEELVWRVVERSASALGIAPADNRRAIAAMIVAMDDGFGLHALIDPSRDPIEGFSVALDFLAEAGVAIATAQKAGTSRPATRPSARQRNAQSSTGTPTQRAEPTPAVTISKPTRSAAR